MHNILTPAAGCVERAAVEYESCTGSWAQLKPPGTLARVGTNYFVIQATDGQYRMLRSPSVDVTLGISRIRLQGGFEDDIKASV